jgi:hypothetical protein
VATRPLSKTFMPSSTQFIPRIFPRGEVTDSHYSKGYYKHDPQYAYPRGARYRGANPAWASWGGDDVRLVDFDRAFVLQQRGRRGTTPVFVQSMPSACSGVFYGCSLHRSSRSDEGIERRVACSPSPQQEGETGSR